MNFRVAWVVSLGVVVAVTGCRRGSASGFAGGGSYSTPDRQEMVAAADAGEWLQRRELDKKDAWGEVLANWYAELPPIAEWPELLAALEQESGKPAAADDQDLFDHSSGLTAEKERLFALLMKGDEAAAQDALRKMIGASRSGGDPFGSESVLNAILALSVDPKEGLEWVKKNKPSLLAERTGGSGHYSDKKEWEKRLADATLDQAVEILKEDLNGDHRNDKLRRLLKVAELAEDEVLRSEVIEMLWADAQKEMKDGSSHGLHSHQTLIEALASDGAWKRLKSLASDLEKAQEAEESNWSGFGNSLESLNWVVSYHVDGAEVMLKGLGAKLESGELVLEDAYTLLKDDGGSGVSLGELYVDALFEAGRKDESWAVMQRLLVMNLRKDAYYERARRIAPEKFGAYLDRLMIFDPFEERPLIWKAEFALAEGKLEEAKGWAEKAIALDPSDGDQGKESRMKVYEVLSRVLAKAGDQEKADFFHEVMVSIREGEVADDYLYAGLIREATERYMAALSHFGDAYCLQSRLALTLARNGRFEEAVPHFEKAFELMPVSFGPRESHCFGCEGLFSDERVRPIAQRILAEFIKKNPDNPRAPYLLGLVLDSMDDSDGAIAAFGTAIEMDPRYFNAASRLLELLKKKPERYGEREELLASMLEIAPYPELGRYYEMRTDLRQAWLDAGNVGESPLKLEEWSFKTAPQEKQFTEGHMIYRWSSPAEKAMDGWSREELCRDNELLETIEGL